MITPDLPNLRRMPDPTATAELREHDLKTADETTQARDAYFHRILLSMTLLARCPALSEGDLEEAFRVLTKMTVRTLYVDRASVCFFDSERSNLRCARTYDERLGGHSRGECLLAAQSPEFFDDLQRGWTVNVEDAERDPRTSAFWESDLWVMDVRALMLVPIKRDRHCLGVLCCQQANGTRQWLQEEREFAEYVSSLVTLVVEVHHRLEAIRHHQGFVSA
jgi:two-component system, sensor histidine kinase and response regulator